MGVCTLIVALCLVVTIFCVNTSGYGQIEDHNLGYFVYFLKSYDGIDKIFISVLIIITFSFRIFYTWKPANIAICSSAIFWGIRAILAKYLPFVSDPLSFHAMTQTGLVFVAAYLAVEITHRCGAVDTLVRTLFAPGAARLDGNPEEAAEKAIGTLQYCRRNNHAVGVIMLRPDPLTAEAVFPEVVRRMLETAARSAVALKVASQVTHGLRRTDVLVHRGENGEIAVLCPEAEPLRLQAMTRRIVDDVNGSLGIPLRTGSAYFPEDALTYEDLLRAASADIDQKAGVGTLPDGSSEDYHRASP